jgi:hypothetical protein
VALCVYLYPVLTEGTTHGVLVGTVCYITRYGFEDRRVHTPLIGKILLSFIVEACRTRRQDSTVVVLKLAALARNILVPEMLEKGSPVNTV